MFVCDYKVISTTFLSLGWWLGNYDRNNIVYKSILHHLIDIVKFSVTFVSELIRFPGVCYVMCKKS